MPVIVSTDFVPSPKFSKPHWQTIMPFLLRKVKDINYTRERIYVPFNDFLDLDWSKVGSRKLVVLLYGLDSGSDQYYVKGMVRAVNAQGWDCVVMNYRGKSGEVNNSYKSYHAGATDDLEETIKHVVYNLSYKEIALVGMSLGGNMILKYAGERGVNIPPIISRIGCISVPIDLESCVSQLELPDNKKYYKRMVKSLKQQLFARQEKFPSEISRKEVASIKTLREFDAAYTAKAHGFIDVDDYYGKNSSKQFLTSIKVPTLLVNAKDDPFLGKECFPIQEVNKTKYVYLELPEQGGHLGFWNKIKDETYWHEARIAKFLKRESFIKL